MTDITIYSKDPCPYCVKAKALFKRKGYTQFTEIDILSDPKLIEEMISRSGGRKTVPQIFIDGIHIGGCDDLHALDAAGKLDPLLKG